MINNTQIIVLAAGKGTRMGADIPKVLMPFRGDTMLGHLLKRAILPLAGKQKPILVVGYGKEQVRAAIGDEPVVYVEQEEQLGTGHAVQIALAAVDPAVENIVVLYGDMPLVTPETLAKLVRIQDQTSNPVTMFTTTVDDYKDWRTGFYAWGRVIRNADNEIEKIVEEKDATPEQLAITEVTSSHFAFDHAWLIQNIDTLSSANAAGEYYLTDLPRLATNQGHKIQSVAADAREVLGANTLAELKILSSQGV